MTNVALYRKYLRRLRNMVEDGEISEHYMSHFAIGFYICVTQAHGMDVATRLWRIATRKYERVNYDALLRLAYL